MNIRPENVFNPNHYRSFWYCLVLCISLLSASSCSSYKNIAYLKDIKDSASNNMPVASLRTIYEDPKIQSNDLLQVTIQTLDPQANSLFSGTASAASVAQQGAAALSLQPAQAPAGGYMVDKNGQVQLPLVGMVKVAGLTTTEARDLISEKAAKYYRDPVVNVRISNFSITVLGEVNHPAAYQVQNEKVSILDALGMAGDLTIYGKRENILLIREEQGEKKFVRFNINSSNIFSSPYFYLKQGDMVYVEPNKAKAANTDMAKTRTYTLLASAFTVLVVLLTRINF